jgi:putative transposase
MGRPRRSQIAGGIYHVTTRGNRRGAIYVDDQDCQWFLGALESVVRRFELVCDAYCLLSNHYHVLFTLTKPNLSAAMQCLNSRYAHAFNWKYGTQGHVFERRFHAVEVNSDAHLLELARYVVLNPIRAGVCSRPAQWPWSSYRAMLTSSPHPFLRRDFLLERFHAEPPRARDLYRRFVDEGLTPWRSDRRTRATGAA